TDVWAVGGQSGKPLILHWDGMAWSVVDGPSVGKQGGELHAVVALSATDAWAVGQAYGKLGSNSTSEHWDGTAWTVVQVPDLNPGFALTTAVDASGPDNVWATGSGTEGNVPETQRFDGS